MTHLLARTLPSIEQLVKEHADYMSLFAEPLRVQSAELTARLNLANLRGIAGHAVGSLCIKVDKIYQGGFNQIFNLAFEDEDKHAIARINMPFGGGSNSPEEERRDRVRSEAATLCWLRENTAIPVPRVYAFDENPANEVGAAYIIEEKILGCTLADIWTDPAMTFPARKIIVEQLASFEAQLMSTSFPQIGSIYTEKNTYYVGPLAPPVEIEPSRNSRGPWKTPREEIKAWLEDQLDHIKNQPDVLATERQKNKVGTPPSTIKEFEVIYPAILTLVENVKLLGRCDPSWAPFSLSHPERGLRNIMVDPNEPTRVIALIDWEGARIRPWWQRIISLPFLFEEVTEVLPEPSKWDDLRQAWSDVLRRMDPPGIATVGDRIGWFLSRINLLAEGGCATWGSMKDIVDDVMEWRLDWPEPDPAFQQLDEIMRRHGAQISLGYE